MITLCLFDYGFQDLIFMSTSMIMVALQNLMFMLMLMLLRLLKNEFIALRLALLLDSFGKFESILNISMYNGLGLFQGRVLHVGCSCIITPSYMHSVANIFVMLVSGVIHDINAPWGHKLQTLSTNLSNCRPGNFSQPPAVDSDQAYS